MKTDQHQQLLKAPFRFYIRQHRRAFALGLGSLFLTNALDTLPPLLIGYAIDQLTGPRDKFLVTLALLIAVAGGISLFRYGWRLFWGRFHHSVADDLRGRIMDHFLELGPSHFQRTQIGKAMALITNDVNLFRMAIGPGVLILFDGISILIMVPILMCTISPSWTIKTLCLMPLVPFFVIYIMRKLNVLFERKQDSFAEMSGVSQEIVAGIRVIKSFALEKFHTRYFNRYSRNFELACNQVAEVDSTFQPGLELFASVGSVILLVLGAPEVIAGQVTLGQFIAFFQYVQRIVWPMTSIGVGLSHVEQGRASFQRIRQTLETAPLILDEGDRKIDSFESLEVRNMSFGFGDGLLLEDVSFSIKKGERLGILGPTGSGKSILLDLIFRFQKAPPLSIFINGIPIERIELKSLRGLFSVVPQDVFLFQESVAENLIFAQEETTTEHLDHALGVAALTEEIQKLPLGLETALGEKGVNLSGGQKQRLTFARAWLKPAPVMVLDDSLSAVDSKTEHHLLEQIDHLKAEQSLLLITHRLSALEGMDQVLVLNQGKVEALGLLRKIQLTSPTVQKLFVIQEVSTP